ncbi:hypothetical protein ACEQPO_05075 [Bacillus sp. SL00103]
MIDEALSVAAVNAKDLCVVSGREEHIATFEETARQRNNHQNSSIRLVLTFLHDGADAWAFQQIVESRIARAGDSVCIECHRRGRQVKM